MKAAQSYRLRLKRKRCLVRAWRKSFELRRVVNRTGEIRADDILVFSTVRNEAIRLPWFLKYYRDLGVGHFLIVDNASTDGSKQFLADQPDVSLWSTPQSYKSSRFGMDWLNHLLRRYADGHWALTVDPDELFIYPFCDTRPLDALTDWLDSCAIRSFGAMLLDMYPKGPLGDAKYETGTDPLKIMNWFDGGNYTLQKNENMGNLWIQGGPRMRQFFQQKPGSAPALNKVPLVKWQRRYAYFSSTHSLLPRGLNLVYDEFQGEKASGLLLHTKFLDGFEAKAQEELDRRQHYDDSVEYRAYAKAALPDLDFWNKWSEQYVDWRQLEDLGLMSKGNWA